MTHVNTALWQESDAALRLDRLVLGQELKLVIFVFEVANVAVTVVALVCK